MVGKSGFIRDPSGLLMSVIRTLEDHTDERHRDLEREKLEEAYSDIDQKLDNAVEGNFKEIKSTIEVKSCLENINKWNLLNFSVLVRSEVELEHAEVEWQKSKKSWFNVNSCCTVAKMNYEVYGWKV